MSQAQGGERVVNAMSVDVEDYFHVSAFDGLVPRSEWERLESRVVDNTGRLLDLFDAFAVRSTFFVLGWVAERHPALVAEIARRGHEVASHGYGHRLAYDQTPAQFRDDVRRAKAVIEDAGGRAVDGYRAPSYSITPRSLWALDVLIETGYRYDSSIFPIHHDRYGIPVSARHAFVIRRPSGSLTEVPASTTRWLGAQLPVSGGGYFRLLPYAWTRWAITRVNRDEGYPIVFYVHPWEIDPGQPRMSCGRIRGFRHYHNLEKTESRLRRLLADFSFNGLDRVLATPPVRIRAQQLAPALPYMW